ncbi:WecB/TagA/CpsF family glycosyltransferase [Mycolicibacterium sp. S3B2]|uniref:WecB/TagA/CpsF family glycosyltransferase n=1 Tax=Mycolicibacterium sp. S3B2 TaxID=3415120 RepID=UPI003C7D299E
MTSTIRRVDVLGVGISAVDIAMARNEITHWVEERQPNYVCVTGVHGVMEAQRDPSLLAIHNDSGLTTPDGMPMVWAGRRAGAHWINRVYGPDLMLSVLERAAERGWTSFLYGGKEGVATLLAARLTEQFPALKIVGTYSPPFRELTKDEDDEVVRRINATGADLIWVGLSTPKQERWMAEHIGRVAAPVLLGVGAAFDFHAGLMPQAPNWMQRSGLEWAYRLGKEPRRLWRRYLRNNPAFLMRIATSPPRLRD